MIVRRCTPMYSRTEGTYRSSRHYASSQVASAKDAYEAANRAHHSGAVPTTVRRHKSSRAARRASGPPPRCP
ncbi:hypothetical protein J7E91_31760 [Streptomyces sp. ISL-99]|uniref:hypothetical protein n=1 Tax=Streptomyces sp. ISL-99 TaxID=2819193 RepID=UPI001BEA7FAB|nr:hypothetical protein [Streptomyces sp. ISL-99]MBT2529827.1 hypothetical protein [Streptomyces sp. ISL-99]